MRIPGEGDVVLNWDRRFKEASRAARVVVSLCGRSWLRSDHGMGPEFANWPWALTLCLDLVLQIVHVLLRGVPFPR